MGITWNDLFLSFAPEGGFMWLPLAAKQAVDVLAPISLSQMVTISRATSSIC